ncbi:MAG: hypothetical protein ABEH78_11410 [Haloferacaceae archaeon]
MAMGPWIAVATALSAVSAVLLLVLTGIWVRNYRQFGTPMVAGLVAFGGVMLLENLVAVYFFFSMGMLYAGSPAAQQTVVVLRALQTVALVFLTAVTVR